MVQAEAHLTGAAECPAHTVGSLSLSAADIPFSLGPSEHMHSYFLESSKPEMSQDVITPFPDVSPRSPLWSPTSSAVS